jgi:hypothetical protein
MNGRPFQPFASRSPEEPDALHLVEESDDPRGHEASVECRLCARRGGVRGGFRGLATGRPVVVHRAPVPVARRWRLAESPEPEAGAASPDAAEASR